MVRRVFLDMGFILMRTIKQLASYVHPDWANFISSQIMETQLTSFLFSVVIDVSITA